MKSMSSDEEDELDMIDDIEPIDGWSIADESKTEDNIDTTPDLFLIHNDSVGRIAVNYSHVILKDDTWSGYGVNLYQVYSKEQYFVIHDKGLNPDEDIEEVVIDFMKEYNKYWSK